MRHGKQSGVALISVLLVFAIVTLLVSQLISRSQLDIERTRWLFSEAQAFQYALGGEALARQLLWQQQKDMRAEGLDISPIPPQLPVYKPESGQMAVEIVDLQGLLNVNNITSNGNERLPVTRLFNNLLLKPELSQVLLDWVDADTTPLPGGAEDNTYLAFAQPYRAANHPLNNPSELLALAGMSAKDVATIKPYITALPVNTPINVNTAPAEIFDVINPGLSGQQIASFRTSNPPGYLTVDEFMLSDTSAGLNLDPRLFTVTSDYFGVKIHVKLVDHNYWLFSRLKMDKNTENFVLLDRIIGEPLTIKTLETLKDEPPADTLF